MAQQINESQVKNLVADIALTRTTQSPLDNSTKPSTTAYTDAAVAVETAARQAQANKFNANFFQTIL